MKNLMAGAMFAVLFVVHTTSAQQSAPAVRELPVDISEDELSRRFILALGGKEAWSRLETTVTRGTLEIRGMDGTGRLEKYEKAPNLDYTRSILPGGDEIVQACDGPTAWERDGDGVKTLQGAERRNALDNCLFLAFVDLKQTYEKLTLVAKSSQDGQEFYLVDALRSDGLKDMLSIDAKTFLLNLIVSPRHIEGEVVPMAVLFGDYRSVGAVTMPHLMRMKIGDTMVTTRITSIRLNEPVDDAIFAMP